MTTPKKINPKNIADASTQTSKPKTLDLFEIERLTADYKKKLTIQYDDYILNGMDKRKLSTDETQLILSFAFPMIRRYNNQDTYNYCRKCRKFKTEDETTNQFCMKSYDEWRQEDYNFNHSEYSICYDCLNRMCCYGYDHEDARYKSQCPICNQRYTFHHINIDNIHRSQIARRFLIKNILKHTSTTTKKINYKPIRYRYGGSNGKNHIQVWSKNDKTLYNINTNSYAFKFSLIYPLLIAEREIYNDADLEIYNNSKGFIYLNKTRAEMKAIIERFADNYTIGNTTNDANYKYRYPYPIEHITTINQKW